MQNIEYRKALQSDYSGINEITKQILGYHQEIRPDIFANVVEKDYDKETFSDEITDDDKCWLVACIDGKICGALLVYITADSRNRVYGYMDTLFVYPEYRSMGIATHLFEMAEEFLRSNDIHSMELNVWQGNDAFDFYKKQGMTVQRYILKKEI